MTKIENIYEDKFVKCQCLVFPKHQKVFFTSKAISEQIKNPKSFVVICHYDNPEPLLCGYVCDFELNYFYYIWSQDHRAVFQNTDEFKNWYLNSKIFCNEQSNILPDEDFRKCDYPFYHLAKKYQPNKLESWKKQDQEHIQNCQICKEEIS